MRRRLSRKKVRRLLDVDRGVARASSMWMVQELSLLIAFLYAFPLFALAIFVPTSYGQFVLFIALVPLLGGYLLFVSSRFGLGEYWWTGLENLLSKAIQVEIPALDVGEDVLLTGFEITSGFWPRRGRLTLTTRRLLFQRPRLVFLPPWRPGPVIEMRLDRIERVESDIQAVIWRMLTCRQPYPVLRVGLEDGSEHEFSSIASRGWRRRINQARRAIN
jgi:hypothetical protein